MFLAFPGGVENVKNVNFSKFGNVTLRMLGTWGGGGHYMWLLHSAEKQSSLLYAVHFIFLAFLDGVENGQNVNFSIFRNVIFTHVGYIGFIIRG